MSELTRLLEVRAAQSTYSVHIAAGSIRQLGQLILSKTPQGRVHVVADRHVWDIHSTRVVSSLTAARVEFTLSLIPSGESSKSLECMAKVLDEIAVSHHERGNAIVALGGGVTTDLAGFVSAIWQRGVPWICCPTSLEAAIDAGIGGKTALNLPAGKNLIGAFHHPLAVIIDLDLLTTLPQRDHVAALAESVKHGVVARPGFLDWQRDHAAAILTRDAGALAQLIETNVAIKAEIVAGDERETSTVGVGRAALNLGHTIGHALEAMPSLDLRHGEAIALGLRAALSLASIELQFPSAERAMVESLLDQYGLPGRAPAQFDPADILARMRLDKKSKDGRIRFVLPRRLSEVVWWTADNTQSIERVLRDINFASA